MFNAGNNVSDCSFRFLPTNHAEGSVAAYLTPTDSGHTLELIVFSPDHEWLTLQQAWVVIDAALTRIESREQWVTFKSFDCLSRSPHGLFRIVVILTGHVSNQEVPLG